MKLAEREKTLAEANLSLIMKVFITGHKGMVARRLLAS